MPWAALIGAVGSYLAASKAAEAGKPTASDLQLQQQMLENLRAGNKSGLDFLNTAKQDIGGASDFANSILRGGYQNLLGLLGPEVAANGRANQGALASSMRFMPRASGTGTERLGLMDNMQANQNNAFLSMRPNAASMLASLGGQAGSIGTSLMGMGNSGSLGLLGFGLNNRMGSFDMSRAAMQGVLQSLAGIDFGGGGGKTSVGQQAPISMNNSPLWGSPPATSKPGLGGGPW